MGRSVFADESIQIYVEQLIKTNKWYTGVIIGQVTQQRDYVIHIARTPDPVEDEAMEDNGEGESLEKDSRKKQSVTQPISMEQLDDKWVSTHAKQVSRMLPGGLSVIGLFALAPTNMLQACQIKLKQMMFSVHKSLTKNPLLGTQNEITDRILLQVDSHSRKMTCTSLDMADGKSVPRPAEWKNQSNNSVWTCLDSQLAVDIPMTVDRNRQGQVSLLKQLQGGLSTFCSSIRQSIVCMDGAIRDDSELLVAQTERKGGKGAKDSKGKGNSAAANTVCQAKVFLTMPSVIPVREPVVSENASVLRICGLLSIKAFVPAKATVLEAKEAVKTDIIRSLCARCELLCEEDDLTEDEEHSSVFSPPIRYFCPSPNSSVEFCDYAFQDEKEDEMRQRIRELLDWHVENLEEVEVHAMEEDRLHYLPSAEENSHHAAVAGGQDKQVSSNILKAYIGAAVGGLVAVLATSVSYLYLGD